MNQQHYQHWQLQQDEQGIYWLQFNRSDASANLINDVVLDEFETILDVCAQSETTAKKIKGLVIFSGKSKGFIAGADVDYFSRFATDLEIETFLRHGQRLFNKLAALSIPTVAMIDGFCLGGGLELALACRYRVAEEGADTRLGLPEVLLGIHPGWGGSVRLPQLVGPLKALPMMLRGEMVSAKQAAKIGLVDAAVPKRQLEHAAAYYINTCPPTQKLSWWLALANRRPLKTLLANYFRKQLTKRIKAEHYPAPFAIVNNWEQAIDSPSQAFEAEVHSIVKLLQQNATAKNLIRVFALQERLKGLAKQTAYAPTRVHVIGAGVMGGDIAAWCAFSGLTVTLQDVEHKNIAAALARAQTLFKKKLKEKRLIQAAMDKLIPDLAGNGVEKADVIIEAIFENLEAKQTLFKQLEQRAKPEALLATNTSSIPLDEINQVMVDPSRLVGIHFFNPVAKMKLVEVVQGAKTTITTVEKACAFVGKISHLPLPVQSCPGFLVNRILMPYLLEAMMLFDEGYSAATIDKAATDFGMPMGPIELADTIGLDVCLAVAKNLTQHYGGTVSPLLEAKIKQGHLGRKTGQGFYHYKKGQRVNETKIVAEQSQMTPDLSLLANRLIFRLLNESFACLREKIVADSDLLDAGMIFGAGFAPFRGGPFHYAHSCDQAHLMGQFQQLQEKFGARFQPDAGFAEYL